MIEYLVDAYAWIEYLDGSEQGEKVKQILEKHKCFTAAITLAEVVSKTKRTGKDTEIAFQAITMNSKILAVNEEIAKKAGIIYAEKREKNKDFGLADAFIIAHREKNQKILTGDPHFKGIENIEFLK